MKKITKTMTTRVVTVRAFDEVNDELVTTSATYFGEKFLGVERDFIPEMQVLKVLEVGEPETKTYSMDINTFIQYAHESQIYMHGFINRKIGGEVANCKCYDLDNDRVVNATIDNDTEKRLEKTLLSEWNYKLIKVESVEKVDEKYYFMDDLMFKILATDVTE